MSLSITTDTWKTSVDNKFLLWGAVQYTTKSKNFNGWLP